MPASTAASTPSTYFEPQDAESLWKLVTTPHPLVSRARHLGEALVNADRVAAEGLDAGLQAQQAERQVGVQRLIGQILVDQGQLSQISCAKPLHRGWGTTSCTPSICCQAPARWRWCRATWPSASPRCRCWRATSQELLLNLGSAAPDNDATEADVVTESDNTLVRLINSII